MDLNLPPVQFGSNSITTDRTEYSFYFFVSNPL